MPISAAPGGARAATFWRPRSTAAAHRFACTMSTAGFRFTPEGPGVPRTRSRRRAALVGQALPPAPPLGTDPCPKPGDRPATAETLSVNLTFRALLLAGPALRRADVGEGPGVYGRCTAHSGARHGCGHRHFQCCGHVSPQAIAVSRRGASAVDLGTKRLAESRSNVCLAGRFPGMAAAEPRRGRDGGIAGYADQPHRRPQRSH